MDSHPPRISLSDLVRYLLPDEQEGCNVRRRTSSRTINSVTVSNYFNLLNRFLYGEVHLLELVDFLTRLSVKHRKEYSLSTHKAKPAHSKNSEDHAGANSGSETFFKDDGDEQPSSDAGALYEVRRVYFRCRLLELSLKVSAADTVQLEDTHCLRLLEEAFKHSESPESLFSDPNGSWSGGISERWRSFGVDGADSAKDAQLVLDDIVLVLLALCAVTLPRPAQVGNANDSAPQRDTDVSDAVGGLIVRGLACVSLVDVGCARRAALACWTIVSIVCERATTASRARLLDSLELLHRVATRSTVLRFTHALLLTATPGASSQEAGNTQNGNDDSDVDRDRPEAYTGQLDSDSDSPNWGAVKFALALVRHVEAVLHALKKLKIGYLHVQARPSTTLQFGSARRDSLEEVNHALFNHHHSLFGCPLDVNSSKRDSDKRTAPTLNATNANLREPTEYMCLIGRFFMLLVDTLRVATHERRSNALAKAVLDALLRVGYCCCLLRQSSDWLVARTLRCIDPTLASNKQSREPDAEQNADSRVPIASSMASQSVVQAAFRFVESLYTFKRDSFFSRCAVCIELNRAHVDACALAQESLRLYRGLLNRTDFASRRAAVHLKTLARMALRPEGDVNDGGEHSTSGVDTTRRDLGTLFVRTVKRRLVSLLLLPLLLRSEPPCAAVSRIALSALVRALLSESQHAGSRFAPTDTALPQGARVLDPSRTSASAAARSEPELESSGSDSQPDDAFLPAVITELVSLTARLRQANDRFSEQQLLALFTALLLGDGDETPRRGRLRRARRTRMQDDAPANDVSRRQQRRTTFTILARLLATFFRLPDAPNRGWLTRLWRTLYIRVATSATDTLLDNESGLGTLSVPYGEQLLGETWCTVTLRALHYPAVAYSQLIQLIVAASASPAAGSVSLADGVLGDSRVEDELELIATLIVFCVRFCARRGDSQAGGTTVGTDKPAADSQHRLTIDEFFVQLLELIDGHLIAGSAYARCSLLTVKLLDTVFDRELPEVSGLSYREESPLLDSRTGRDGYEADHDFEFDEPSALQREMSASRSESDSTLCCFDRRRRSVAALIDTGAVRAVVRFSLDLVECLLRASKFEQARIVLARLLVAAQHEQAAMACLIEIDLPSLLLVKIEPLITQPPQDSVEQNNLPDATVDDDFGATLSSVVQLLTHFHRVSPPTRTHVELYIRAATEARTCDAARNALLDVLVPLLRSDEQPVDEHPPARSYTFSFDAAVAQPVMSLCCLLRLRSAELESRLRADAQLDVPLVSLQLLVLTNRYDVFLRLRAALLPDEAGTDWRRRLNLSLSISCVDASSGQQHVTLVPLPAALLDDRFHLLTLQLHPASLVFLDANRLTAFGLDSASGRPLQLTATLFDSAAVRTRQCYMLTDCSSLLLVYLALLGRVGPVLDLSASRADRLLEYRVPQDSSTLLLRCLFGCQLSLTLAASPDDSVRRAVYTLLHRATDAELLATVRLHNTQILLPVEVQLFQTGSWSRSMPPAAIEWPDEFDCPAVAAFLDAGGSKLLLAAWLRLLDARALPAAQRLLQCLLNIVTRDEHACLDLLRLRGLQLLRRALLCTARVQPHAAAALVPLLLEAATLPRMLQAADEPSMRLVRFPALLRLAFDVQLLPMLGPRASCQALRFARDMLLCDVATLPDIVACVQFNGTQLTAVGLPECLLTVLVHLSSDGDASTPQDALAWTRVVHLLADVLDRLLLRTGASVSLLQLADHLVLTLCALDRFPTLSRPADVSNSVLFRVSALLDLLLTEPARLAAALPHTDSASPARRRVASPASRLQRVAAMRLAHALVRAAPFVSDAAFAEVCSSGALNPENLLVLLVRLCNDAGTDADSETDTYALPCALLRVVLTVVERLVHQPKATSEVAPAVTMRVVGLVQLCAAVYCSLAPTNCVAMLADMATRLCFALPLATPLTSDSELEADEETGTLADAVCDMLPVAVPECLPLFVSLLVAGDLQTMRAAAPRALRVVRSAPPRTLHTLIRSGVVLEPLLVRILACDSTGPAASLLSDLLGHILSALLQTDEADDDIVEETLNLLLYVWLVTSIDAALHACVALLSVLLTQQHACAMLVGRGVLLFQLAAARPSTASPCPLDDRLLTLLDRLLDAQMRELSRAVQTRANTLRTRCIKQLHSLLVAAIRLHETLARQRPSAVAATAVLCDRLASFVADAARRVAADKSLVQPKQPLAALCTHYKSRPVGVPLSAAERAVCGLLDTEDTNNSSATLQANVLTVLQRASAARLAARTLLADAEHSLIERHASLSKRWFERLGALEMAESLETRLWFDLIVIPLAHPDAALPDDYFYPDSWQRDSLETMARERPRLVRAHLPLAQRFLSVSVSVPHCQPVPRFLALFNRTSESMLNAHVLHSDRSTARSSFANVTCISPRGELHVQLLLSEIRLYVLLDRATHASFDRLLHAAAQGCKGDSRAPFFVPSHAWLTDDGVSRVFTITDLRDVRATHYRLRNAACELLFTGGQSLLLAFESVSSRNELLAALLGALRMHWPRELVDTLFACCFETDFALLEAVRQKWQRSQLTNYDYLVIVNHLAGRSPNDFSQYPIFPFLLKAPANTKPAKPNDNPDAAVAGERDPFAPLPLGEQNEEQLNTQRRIDLDDETMYRALSKPIAVQNARSRQRYSEKYKILEQFYARREESGVEANNGLNTNGGVRASRSALGISALASSFLGKPARLARTQSSLRRCSTTRGVMTVAPHHFSAFVSNPGVLAHYLVRVPPATLHHIHLHDGQFDLADRQFHAIDTTYRVTTGVGDTEPKELIPEFFYFTDFLHNAANLQLGTCQNDIPVDDVQLPSWAGHDTRLFVRVQRQALEAQPVSLRLHKWIDLLFGFRQRGDPAVRAVNTYHPFIYLGSAANTNNDHDADLLALAAASSAVDTDSVNAQAILTIIATYGSVPKQLFGEPHPAKTHLRRRLVPRALSHYIHAKKVADRSRNRERAGRQAVSITTSSVSSDCNSASADGDADADDADADVGVDALFLSTVEDLDKQLEQQDRPVGPGQRFADRLAEADTVRTLEFSDLEDPIWSSVFSLNWGIYCGSPSEPAPERVRRVRVVAPAPPDSSPSQSYRRTQQAPFRRPTRQLSAADDGAAADAFLSTPLSLSRSPSTANSSATPTSVAAVARSLAARRIAAFAPPFDDRLPVPPVELLVTDDCVLVLTDQLVVEDWRCSPFSLHYTSDGRLDPVRSRLNALLAALRIRERVDCVLHSDDDEEGDTRELRRRASTATRYIRLLRLRDNTLESALARADVTAPVDSDAGLRVLDAETNRTAELVRYRRPLRATALAMSYQFACLLVGTSRGDVDIYRLPLVHPPSLVPALDTRPPPVTLTSLQSTLHVFRPLLRYNAVDQPVHLTPCAVAMLRVADDFGLALAVCTDGRCALLDLNRQRVLRQLARDEQFCCVAALTFCCMNGEFVLAFNGRATCTICSTAHDRHAYHPPECDTGTDSTQSGSGSGSGSGGPRSQLALYDANGRLLRTCQLRDYVTCLASTSLHEGSAINAIAGGLSGCIRFWQSWTLEPFRDVQLDTLSESSLSDYVSALAFSADHRYLFALTESGYLNVWHTFDSFEEQTRKQVAVRSRSRQDRKRLRARERKQVDNYLNSLQVLIVR